MGDSRLFVVRVWLDDDSFRAVARDVASETSALFTRREDLIRFLESPLLGREAGCAPDAACAPGATGHAEAGASADRPSAHPTSSEPSP